MSNDFETKLWDIVERLDLNFRAQGRKDIESILQAGVDSYDDLLVPPRSSYWYTMLHEKQF